MGDVPTLPDMHTVAMALYDGAMLFEAAAACEVFGVDRSDLATEPWYDFRVCGPRHGRVGAWLRVETPYELEQAAEADTVVVPACEDPEAGPPAEAVEVVRAAYERGARIVSLCTGAFVLAAAGILDGRRATTHWRVSELLARTFPQVDVDPDPIFVQDGNVYTSAGVTSGMDLALALVEDDHGREVALRVARRLVLFLRRPANQSQFSAHLGAQMAERDGLREAQRHVVEQPHADCSVAALARVANMSERNFTRCFTAEVGLTPARYVERIRVETARRLLEDTDQGVEVVAGACGFGTSETMRRTFLRLLHTSPSEYRRRFRAA